MNGIVRYLIVTPLGKIGYLFSRIIVLSVISTIYSLIIFCIFHLTNINILIVLLLSAISIEIGIMVSFGIIAFAHNKVEGMALSKFSGILLIGLFISVFVKNNIKYCFFWMPTFWIGEFYLAKSISDFLIGFLLTVFFIAMFYKKMRKKLL